MNVLIEGSPGVGKTTLVKRIISQLENYGGFCTQEIREAGLRVGFLIEDCLTAEMGILAHRDSKSKVRVGDYGVNLEDLDRIGVQSIKRAIKDSDFIIIDEIGKMEMSSSKFQKAVVGALDSPKPLIATITPDSHPFADKIKKRGDVKLFKLTFKNRESLAAKVLGYIRNNKR